MTTRQHPFREGNYLPVREERSLEACEYEGELPEELAGGMYVRNGGEPSLGETQAEAEAGPAYHWFDGDGMLTGVYFARDPSSPPDRPRLIPTFVNKYVLTDVFLASRALGIKQPILPSIATLLGSVWTLPLILFAILRAVFLACASFFTSHPLRHLSVANTSISWHDGRALAACESGPLTWVTLPALDTVGYWSLEGDQGEPGLRDVGGTLGWMKEWTTAHPKRDPHTGELLLFHMTFLPPFLHYSVIPSTHERTEASEKRPPRPRILAAPVPIAAPRMMHDMAASRTHSILLDMPLSLDPRNLVVGKPVIAYDPTQPARFGVLPRHEPDRVRWYEAPACIIFHTAFAFDEYDAASRLAAVNLVACRLNSPRLVYAAGNLDLPAAQALASGAKEACELYYYRFPLASSPSDPADLAPSHAFPLAAIPFEFPTVPQDRVVGPSKYVYGCSIKHGNFDEALGGAAKIDCLVKVNVDALVRRGVKRAEAGEGGPEQPIDERTVVQVLAEQTARQGDASTDDEPLRIFELPPRHFAQESSFVPRAKPRSEDDGFLLTYVFDEHQLDPASGRPKDDAKSELWVIDAWDMRTVVAKVKLPQRVPYGLHGHWFPHDEVSQQRPPPSLRTRIA
ncbi:carotenoid oxygenase family protein [Rhodotorula paludigena]|uniref:carotenoid oxygenase family protein n=1 Tax=Rhodotorula paludigena TaxID=86838 RepID=UPI00317B11B9